MSKLGNTELMAALKEQMKGEWWKWKTSRASVLVDMEPMIPNYPRKQWTGPRLKEEPRREI